MFVSGRHFSLDNFISEGAAAGKSRPVREAVAGTICVPPGRADRMRGSVRIRADTVRRPVIFSCSGRYFSLDNFISEGAAAGKSRPVREAVAGTICAPPGRGVEELKEYGFTPIVQDWIAPKGYEGGPERCRRNTGLRWRGACREFFCFPERGFRCSTDRTVHGVLRSGVVGLIVLLVNVLSFSERTGRQFGRHLSAVGWLRTVLALLNRTGESRKTRGGGFGYDRAGPKNYGPAVRSASFCCRLAEAVSEWMRTDRIGCGGSEWLGGRGTNDFLSGRGCFRRIAICSVVSSRGMGTIRKVCRKGFCVGNTSVRSGHAPAGIAGAQETIKKGAGRK